MWEYKQALPPPNNAAEATFFWKSDPALSTPNLQAFQIEVPFTGQAMRGHCLVSVGSPAAVSASTR